jgi:hypothetical protein
MQAEIVAAHPAKTVRILGLNAVGQEIDNALMCSGRVLPWLQDTAQQNVWGSWNVTWRDVFVLDTQNRVKRIYNLTTYDLAVPANYDTLKNILLNAAR